MSGGVFVPPFPMIEGRGHVAEFWSDDDRMSWVKCHCGYKSHYPDAQTLVDIWRDHTVMAHLDDRKQVATIAAMEQQFSPQGGES